MEKRIFRFAGDVLDWTNKDDKVTRQVLGGKGAGLVMMCQAGMNVPPGFTITTDVCNEFSKYQANDQVDEAAKLINGLMAEVTANDGWLKQKFGFAPLVSVRSGAAISMPGMMDTILNVGLTTQALPGWEQRIGKRAAIDSYRRLIQMLGATAFEIPMEKFDDILADHKKLAKVTQDTELSAEQLLGVVAEYKAMFKLEKGTSFPDTRDDQLSAAVAAVFNSWMNPRAIEYRKIHKIPESMGTACTVQCMVFGNMGDDSGTGVLFSRDPSTGANEIMGEFLPNAQGEDVVAGIRTPLNLHTMEKLGGVWVDVYAEIGMICDKLEDAYSDMVDIEFTVQKGQLFVLQSRAGKRSARAAFKIAVDQVAEGVIDRKTALKRLTKEQFKIVRRPTIDPAFKVEPNMVGLPACPGVATGKPVFSSEDAVNCAEPCILVTHETDPDDIAGMAKAQGILTQTGGATSHAAVVARAMDKTCVVGCTALNIEALKQVAATPNPNGSATITIDGATGRVWIGVEVPVIDSSDDPAIRQVVEWCLEELGAREIGPVDMGGERKHVVAASFWWGYDEAMHAILKEIGKLPYKNGQIRLDMRRPNALMPKDDDELLDAFGTEEEQNKADVAFGERLLDAIKQHCPNIGMGPGANAVPGDFAAFTVLGQ